jgi:uncharacterized phage protein gp47/JayE
MAIEIKSFNQILGEMARKLLADTPLNDLNSGSVLLTLLEAAAQVDFENNASILSVLELLSIDAIRNSDLDARAGDYGLERTPALKATGFVTIKDGNISKRSTGLYQVKSAPIAGSTQIYVNDASDWAPTGTLFIGRGTQNFEGPIAYTSIVNNTSFFTINLGSALQKDHLISDVVVDSQGTSDRLIAAGTFVAIPANNQNPAIEFLTLRNAVIPAGEDTVENIDIVASIPGSRSNAGINTITSFVSPPFVGAQVFNPVALTNGSDVESDNALRERLKSYASTLARGTQPAILSAIIGVSDQDDSKQVASAVITEPPKIGDPSIIYIDDGSGFQPSFAGQSVDKLLGSATGNEEFLQLANFPLPRPQVINTADGPYELRDGMQLRVVVDGVEEAITFSTAQFVNIAAARLSEIIIAINDQSSSFKATFTSNSSRMLLFPVAHDAEIIQVSTKKATDDPLLFANDALKFPTNEFSYIRLYQNNELLNEREKAATLLTQPFSSWSIATTGNIIIAVDGTPAQDQSFSTSDFGGNPFATLTIEDWVAAFNAKFAGITATATSSGRMQLTSNKEGAESSLEVLGGTYLDKLFGTEALEAEGQNSDFQLNRQTGNLRILRDIEPGDSISAGIEDAKGAVFSETTQTGNYNVSADSNSRAADVIVVADSEDVVPRIGVGLAVGNTLTVTDQGSSVMRIMSDSATSFAAVQPDDFVYIVSRGVGPWIDPANCGLYRIIAKGEHTSAGVDTYIEMKNLGIVPGVHVVLASEDIQAFKADTYPQLWKGTFTSIPATASIQDIVDSFNDNIVNIKASIFKTNSVKLTSTTEEDGSFAIPVSVGRAALVFDSQGEEQKGNPSHIANRTSSKDVAAMFKRTEPTATDAEGVSGKVVWLDRVQYTDIKGPLTASAAPGTEGVDTYSEELQSTGVLTEANVGYDDIYNATSGANKGHYRSVRDKLAGDKIGTQHELPRTLMDHIAGDTFNLMRPVGISSEDSIVFIIDQDPVTKTIDIPMSRRGRVNTNFPATNLSFSADDADNEPGITFGNLQTWGKTSNGTEFKNYAVWWRARNWYVSGGATSGGGAFIVRSKEYGPHGENLRFSINYPSFPNQENIVSHENTPDYTAVSYFFGSGVLKPISVVGGDTFTVTSLGSDVYRLTFGGAVNFATVIVGDMISMLNDSGVSSANRGQYRIINVNIPGKYIDVYNPNGAATTGGTPEVTDVTTVADVLGTQTVSTISNITSAAAINGKWFRLRDSAGQVAVWYNAGTPAPSAGSLGVNRVLEIGPLTGAESAATVTALTSGRIDADPMFTASYVGTTVTATNVEYGAILGASDGTTVTGFTFGSAVGSAANSLNGKYFVLRDQAGSVAFWYDTTGVTPEPLHGATRAVRISTVVAGDSANTVATKTAVVVNGDLQFSATALGAVVTVTDANNGARPAASAGTSGFAVSEVTNGSSGTFETITIPTSVMVFPLANTAVTDIVTKMNESPVIEAVATSTTNPIVKSTYDELYTPAGPTDYSVSLAYGHDPDPSSGLNGYISFYDGINYVKQFENTNPNFALKTETTLQGVAPSAYSMVTAPNVGTSDLGEYFKLVPTTLNNVYHHFTQKALSQLPIVAGVDISNNIRRIQIKSKLLGSAGAVEVVGGNANNVSFSIFGEAQVSPGLTKDYLEAKIAAFPVTLTEGDLVRVSNDLQAKRKSRLQSGDTIDVVKGLSDNVEYLYNAKIINTNQFVRMTIADVSATYARPSGTVWRWTPNDGGSVFDVTAMTLGAPGAPVSDEIAAGGTDAAALQRVIIDGGSVSTYQHFQLTVSAFPTQGDYFTFRNGGATFAVWFSVDGNVTAPTGATYVAATNKIPVAITTGMTEDQVVSALATTLLGNVAFLANFTAFQSEGANFDDVNPGDLLSAYGTFPAGWSSGNKAKASGDGAVAGLPIIFVDAAGAFIDVVNPDGVAMTNQAIGTGTVAIHPTPIIQWNLKHAAKTNVVQIVLAAPLGTATVTTSTQHKLREGDTFILADNGIAQTTTVVSVPSATSFTFTDTTASAAGTYILGNVIRSGRTPTRYKIESLNFNGLMRLSYVDGDAPGFVDCGVAVDDILAISGSTFESANAQRFRILGVDNTSLIYEHADAVEELNTLVAFNNLSVAVTWTANSNLVLGNAGDFKNVAIGDWVKKPEDEDDLYVQVIGLLNNSNSPVAASIATKLLLGDNYRGTSAVTQGVSFDQNSDVGKGVYLQDMGDIAVYEGDSVQIADSLFVDRIANASWFSNNNSGTFQVSQIGTDGTTYRPFLRTKNAVAQNQTLRAISVSPLGFFLIENENAKYESIRRVEHTAIDSFNDDRRVVYMTPATGVDKLSQSNGTKISPLGKLDYITDVTTGIDGYTYYTGLLRTVQRIVDGFEPDPVSYPGRRAVGGIIETLPPLIKRVVVSIEVTTNEGVNLNEITNDIKSAIIDYIDGLGVGEDVILSEIIVKVMGITGVAAVTFNVPSPTTERISVADNEKAFIEPNDISIA